MRMGLSHSIMVDRSLQRMPLSTEIALHADTQVEHFYTGIDDMNAGTVFQQSIVLPQRYALITSKRGCFFNSAVHLWWVLGWGAHVESN